MSAESSKIRVLIEYDEQKHRTAPLLKCFTLSRSRIRCTMQMCIQV